MCGIGGVLFLGAVEHALQTRWRAGLSSGFMMLSDVPVLRLPIPENPAPQPFDPAIIEQLDATTVVEPGNRVERDAFGNLVLTV